MKRALVDTLPLDQACISLPEDESHHLIKVRRLASGDVLEVIDGRGRCVLGRLEVLGKRRAQVIKTSVLATGEESPPLRESLPPLVLGLAIPTHLKTLDECLPALVQLGVNDLFLAPSRFGGSLKKRQDKYFERLETICRQALKQSGRLVSPHIEFCSDWPRLCAQIKRRCDHILALHPGGSPLARVAASLSPSHRGLGLLIGPEGGFSEEEIAQAKGVGAILAGLGPRILKMETALVGAAFWARQTFDSPSCSAPTS